MPNPEPEDGRPTTLAARLLAGGVPPSLLIDLLDPVGMQHALESELAEAEAARTLRETAVPDDDAGSGTAATA